MDALQRLLIHHSLCDTLLTNAEGAIARKRAVDPVTAARWEAVYKNATEYQPVATVPSTGTM